MTVFYIVSFILDRFDFRSLVYKFLEHRRTFRQGFRDALIDLSIDLVINK